jgi:hypothetical protein
MLLASLGASPWLIRHHELVVAAGEDLVARLERELGIRCDHARALLGCALHDAGKIRHPEEQHQPGHAHETAGEALLVAAGVPPIVARHAVTHASWATADRDLEDLLVALADKVWKGVREPDLENRVVREIAALTRREVWDVFGVVDSIVEDIAASGTERLRRSRDL